MGAWLGLFGALSGLSRRERADVEEELSDHLRERVRELMVRGLDEHEAVRAAIEELGGAAEMAARFRSVTANSRRRLAMNLSMLGLAGAAAVLSVVAVLQPGVGGGPSVYTPPGAVQTAGPLSKVIDLEFTNVPAAEVFRYLGETAGLDVNAHWADLESQGLGRDFAISVAAKRVPVGASIGLIADSCCPNLDYRLTERTLEIASREYFDRRESVLASYDLEPASARGAASDEVIKVVESLVEPNGWRDNGGDIASVYVLGNRMFVEAPPRYHEKIKWILSELASGNPAPAGDGKPLGAATGAQGSGRRYLLSNASATELCERLRHMVGGAQGLRIEADSQTNSLLVVGSPEAVEAAVVSGMDVAKGADAGSPQGLLYLTADGGKVVLSMQAGGHETRLSADRIEMSLPAGAADIEAEGDGVPPGAEPSQTFGALELTAEHRVPYLSDLPLIGYRFR